MLALPQRRQHLTQHHLSSPVAPQPFSLDTLNQQLSQQQYVDQKLLDDYLDSQQTAFNPSVVIDHSSNPFMTTGAYDFANPQIRVQQSTPTPQLNTAFSPSPMLSTHSATSALENWGSYSSNNGQASQSLQTPHQSRTARTHQRASSSSSSIGSSGSQYQPVVPTAGYQTFSNVPNHLPTPTPTPTQDSFLSQNDFSSYTSHTPGMDSTMAAHMSMKQALLDQHAPEEDVPGFAHSARHSVSSYSHDSPATPHTAQGDDMDFKMPPNDMRPVPKFERTYTDVAADYAYHPNTVVTQTQSIPPKTAANTLLSPYRTGTANEQVQHHLQMAQIARSQSPSSTVSRGDSPFRRGSPYRQPNGSFQSPRMKVGTAAAAREQKAEAEAAYAMKSQVSQAEEKTISPKDALLHDFHPDADEESKVPLFPDGGASEYDHQYNGGDQYRNATQSTFDTTSQSFRRDSWAAPQFSSNFTTSVTGASQAPSTFAFVAPPPVQGNLQGLPFNSTPQYRSVPQMPTTSEQNPEFPAHLTSMESSCSEMEPSSQSSDHLQKPARTKADSGTYTCTYHGCTQRFETPQKLQKHKREGHRNAASIGGAMGSTTSMTSVALLERNSQAGPHKCERINPTTGKPCNTIFSRPYDLTRHEDTIHNVRKQKVRCALCVEEKTFSRNDALTRHMRVVHPEVDFPGKHRRRGGNHD